jgi:hypothetical protein
VSLEGCRHARVGLILPGRSPQEVEDQITYPLTVSLQGLAGVRVVRSSSAFGFSMINVIFEDAVDLYFARSRVLERLNLLSKSLPPGVVPTLGPDATGVGHVFWYTVERKGYSLPDLRSVQDWYIRYQLNAVPAVAEVASVGGTVRQYQIDVDPNRLRGYRIPLPAVVKAVITSNRNVGGNVVEGSGAAPTPCSSGAAMAHRLGRPHQRPQAPPRPCSLPLSRLARHGALGRARGDREQSARPGSGEPTIDMNVPVQGTCSGAEARKERTGRPAPRPHPRSACPGVIRHHFCAVK